MKESDAESALKGLSPEEFLELLEKGTPQQLEALAAVGQQARVNTNLMPVWLANSLAAPEHHGGVASIIVWWERRRLAYNLVIGFCGLPTLAIIGLGVHAPMHVLLSGTAAWAIGANICYTIGSPAESLAWFLWRRKAAHLGPVLLTLGTVFSVCLTAGVGLLMLCSLLLCRFLAASTPEGLEFAKYLRSHAVGTKHWRSRPLPGPIQYARGLACAD